MLRVIPNVTTPTPKPLSYDEAFEEAEDILGKYDMRVLDAFVNKELTSSGFIKEARQIMSETGQFRIDSMRDMVNLKALRRFVIKRKENIYRDFEANEQMIQSIDAQRVTGQDSISPIAIEADVYDEASARVYRWTYEVVPPTRSPSVDLAGTPESVYRSLELTPPPSGPGGPGHYDGFRVTKINIPYKEA